MVTFPITPDFVLKLGYCAAKVLSRADIADSFVSSYEYDEALVRGWYSTYLHREPDDKGFTDILTALANGVRDQEIEASFVASDEYYAMATSGSGPDEQIIGAD